MAKLKRSESLHERIIDRLIEATPGAQRYRFKQAVLDAVWGKCGSHEKMRVEESDPSSEYEDCERCEFSECIGDAPRPDAFLIDRENRDIIVYEVEVSHQVTVERALQYADLFWVVDEEYWLVRLIVVDRFEGQREIDVVATEWGALNPHITDEQIAAYREFMGIRKPGERTDGTEP